ncbi:GumC family protein [Stakelama marina]|uniref:non-specific protein-tyrosine kinase n=1 Tax=Stakelama marina TaxID=2826939 RepID=A0A8T4IAP7_9SPHN|nr:polysaccharide biosynthesis tyrosine autokinase [Stakelama marina]MBR0552098.1 polysaccharide biosynthesis tyrosine autokinase [Stakelama marina]
MNYETLPSPDRPAAVRDPDIYPESYGDHTGGFGIDFHAIWLIIKRNLWLIGGIVAVAVAIGLIVTMLMTPQYVATASVQIDQQAAQVLDSKQDVEPAASYQDADRFLQTQVDVLNSRAMAVRVAQALGLFSDSDTFFKQMEMTPPIPDPAIKRETQLRDAVLETIANNLSVTLPRNSRVASISFESPDSNLAARIANSYASEFIKNNLQRKFDSTAYARNFLSQQLGEAKARLEQSERDLNAYARQAGLIKTDQTNPDGTVTSKPASVTTSSLVQLNQSANDATAARIAAEEKWRTVQSTPLLSIPDVLANKAIQDLLQQRATTNANLNDELARHREAYPTVIQLKAQLAEINNQINSIATSIKQSIKQQYEAARDLETSLNRQVNQLKGETLTEQDRSVRYNILAREADTNRTLYEGLLQRFKEVSAAAGITASNISVVDEANAPIIPSSPKLVLNLALALLAGLALAGGVVFIREQLDDVIRSPEDIERKLGLTTLGVIPTSEAEVLIKDLENPRSSVSEAYNSLRTALLYSTADGLPQVLHITSSGPGEGKSTTSYALATSLAKLGKRVVLVDVDLRRPAVHQTFGIPAEPGLTDLLTTDRDITGVVRETGIDNLTIVPSGPVPPSPTELLGHPRMLETMDQLKRLFDVIILDGPPVLGLADAPLLASIAGNTIFVAEANRGHRGAAKTAIRRLQTAHAHILGAVLTKFDPKKSSSDYGYYGYSYYRYGNE